MQAAKQKKSETTRSEGDNAPYRCVSADLRVDVHARTVSVKKHIHRSDEEPWLELPMHRASLPATPLVQKTTRLADNELLFWIIVAALDTYLMRQKGSKSYHLIVSDIFRTLLKIFEYMWLHGLYDPRCAPVSSWENLREALVEGGWVEALQVERRVVETLAGDGVTVGDFMYETRNPGRSFNRSVRSSLLALMGTNVAARELAPIKNLLIQAERDTSLRKSGNLSLYRRSRKNPMSTTMLKQSLRVFDLLADLPSTLSVQNLPSQSSYDFAEKYGRKGGRTKNIDPDTWARLLSHSYKWIYDYGSSVVELVRALALHLEPYYDADMQKRARQDSSVGSYRSQLIRRAFPKIGEVQALEELIGKRITNLVRKKNGKEETSVYAILNQFYSSCFVVIASMNGRRQDEVLSRTIGLHIDSMWFRDQELGISECEFYIEKTAKDYVPYLINDVTRRAIELLKDIAEVAWTWSSWVNPGKVDCLGRERKLFIFPDFACAKKGVPLWFDFNANADKSSESFVSDALGSDSSDVRVAAHMFRRAYGLLYHYRYENSSLLALTQKYGHMDTATTLHYVTDDPAVPFQKAAVSKWSAPIAVVRRAQADHVNQMSETIREVGEEKLRAYVLDVIKGSRTFSGGFQKLVARFHRRLEMQISYRSLDAESQSKKLSDALIDRGHSPYPYPATTCMAGSARKHAACGVDNGKPARERASPSVCGGCIYSDTSVEHLAALEMDERRLAESLSGGVTTVSDLKREDDLGNLRRIIALHRKRLGA